MMVPFRQVHRGGKLVMQYARKHFKGVLVWEDVPILPCDHLNSLGHHAMCGDCGEQLDGFTPFMCVHEWVRVCDVIACKTCGEIFNKEGEDAVIGS